MDRDTESDFNTPSLVVFECEVCGFKSEFHHEQAAAINEQTADWCLHFLEVRGGTVRVMTCPQCAEKDQGAIFEGYQCRIRAGGDLRFH
jgi:Zn ribbon nucleic-acid-binding protein